MVRNLEHKQKGAIKMGVTKISKDDMKKIDAYMYLSMALVTREAGRGIIDTPEATIIFDTFADLMEDIDENLKIMREQVEPELWQEAWSK